MALQDTLKVEMLKEHWDRVAPVFCVFHFSLTGTVIVALRAPSLAKFGEVDTVPVSEKPRALLTFRPLGYPIKP